MNCTLSSIEEFLTHPALKNVVFRDCSTEETGRYPRMHGQDPNWDKIPCAGFYLNGGGYYVHIVLHPPVPRGEGVLALEATGRVFFNDTPQKYSPY